jgi:hypothetical protein
MMQCWITRWIIAAMALLLALPCRGLATEPTTEPAALARVDALLDDAGRKLAAGVNPEEDCRAAAALVDTMIQQHAIDDVTARQYASQIAYIRATAGETIVAAAYKQAEADIAALQSKLADDKSRLLSPATEATEARRLAAELAAAAHQATADLRALPSDDRRTTDLGERLSSLQQQLQLIAARHSVHQTVQSLGQQWQQMTAQSSSWQDETLPPWAEALRQPDPLVSLEKTRALIVSCGAMLSSAAVDRARSQAGDDADLDALLAEVRSDQQAAVAKASAAIADLLDQADRESRGDRHTAAAGEAAAMTAIAQSLRTSLAVLPDAQALAVRADGYAQRWRAGSTATATAAIAAPVRPAPVVAVPVSPTPARVIVAPPRATSTTVRATPASRIGPADLSFSMPTHRDGVWARLAWTLTGVLAALLAFSKSQLDDETPGSLPGNAGAATSARLYAFSRIQLDPVGLILVALGAWWLLSSPSAALVPAIAMILCGLLGAIDLIGNRLALSQKLVETAHCIAGPASVAAMFIFIVHLFIGGAGFI